MTDPSDIFPFFKYTSTVLDPCTGYPYVEELRERILQLVGKQHKSIQDLIQDVENRPGKLDSDLIRGALRDAQRCWDEDLAKSKSRYFSKAIMSPFSQSNKEVKKFTQAFTDAIIKKVMRLSEKFVKLQNSDMITQFDIRIAMYADEDLVDLFLSDDKSSIMSSNHPIFARLTSTDKHNDSNNNGSEGYKKKIKRMRDNENVFIRDLQLLIKVFKAQLKENFHHHAKILFCNIDELSELSFAIVTILEDAYDSAIESGSIPYIGSEILDLAQAEEFRAYLTFTERLISEKIWKDSHDFITNKALIDRNFGLAIKYLLPKYILNIIEHFFQLYDDLSDLQEVESNKDDQNSLCQTTSILKQTKFSIQNILIPEEKCLLELLRNDLDPKQTEIIRQTEKELLTKLNIILNQEKNLPLPYMPPTDLYLFSEIDSPENIQFEIQEPEPVIKCATLMKLVERMTYHKLVTTEIVDTFLLTYRSFIEDPHDLLEHLIKRYHIPDPPKQIVCPNYDDSQADRKYRNYLRQFRKDYTILVKVRVINVIKHWSRHYYCDFERDSTLLDILNDFLNEIDKKDPTLRQQTNSIRDTLIKKQQEMSNLLSGLLITRSISKPEKRLDLLELRPRVFAEQLTLVEFELYKALKPLDFIPDDQTKSSGQSPNLVRMANHFSHLSFWIRNVIIEVEDLSVRSDIYNRVIEIMHELRDLKNFTGLLIIGCALHSSPIIRLTNTTNNITNDNKKTLEDYWQLTVDHQKKLQIALKKCNPPCIPFLGSYQTKLLHANVGNQTFIDKDKTPNSPTSPGPGQMINFTKQRIMANIVKELSSYQKLGYEHLKKDETIQGCILSIEEQLVEFAKSVGWIDGSIPMDKFLDDYQYKRSELIEAPKKRS